MQVSHHPPIGAAHAENENWTYDIVSAPTTKFLGNAVDIYPVGALQRANPNQAPEPIQRGLGPALRSTCFRANGPHQGIPPPGLPGPHGPTGPPGLYLTVPYEESRHLTVTLTRLACELVRCASLYSMYVASFLAFCGMSCLVQQLKVSALEQGRSA